MLPYAPKYIVHVALHILRSPQAREVGRILNLLMDNAKRCIAACAENDTPPL